HALPIPAGVGGRFSVLSPVGLFPAAAAGVDVEELLAGAAHMDERCKTATSALDDPACVLAAALVTLANERRKPVVVLMPYCERLEPTADWFCQLWAESLGKGGWGQTPVRALGAADQHSQLQLWVDGPPDKVVLFVRVEDHGATVD